MLAGVELRSGDETPVELIALARLGHVRRPGHSKAATRTYHMPHRQHPQLRTRTRSGIIERLGPVISSGSDRSICAATSRGHCNTSVVPSIWWA
jgi:hypothetical protein